MHTTQSVSAHLVVTHNNCGKKPSDHRLTRISSGQAHVRPLSICPRGHPPRVVDAVNVTQAQTGSVQRDITKPSWIPNNFSQVPYGMPAPWMTHLGLLPFGCALGNLLHL